MSQLASARPRASVAVTGATKTLAATDCGTVQNVNTVTSVITLPSTAAGLTFTIRNGGSGSTDGAITIKVSPAAADKIMGLGYTATDNKGAINTLGAGGDEITLVGDGSLGWYVVEAHGTWTREA